MPCEGVRAEPSGEGSAARPRSSAAGVAGTEAAGSGAAGAGGASRLGACRDRVSAPPPGAGALSGKTRAGKVREIGLADKRLTAGRGGFKRLLQSYGRGA